MHGVDQQLQDGSKDKELQEPNHSSETSKIVDDTMQAQGKLDHMSNTEIPDGGYGWVVVACMFLQNAATWGVNTAFGVYLSFYRKTNFFPGASNAQFAIIGGLSISLALAIAPLANFLTLRYNFKVSMALGLIFYVGSQILAAFSKHIWQLILTQGVLFGIGSGLIFCASVAIPSQWFLKRRALALGIAASGSGAGALVLSITTRLAIERLSLRWAFIINALISFIILAPVIFLLKDRVKLTRSKFHPFQFGMLVHKGFVWVWLWGSTNVLGYVLALYTLATYSTAGLNLSQAQGSNLQAILATGQMIGRPACGLLLDKFGRVTMTATLAFISGLSCLLIWMFGRTYGLLIFFALVQGLVGGTIWGASAPVTAQVVGLSDLGSALSVLWVTVSIPALFAEPIGVWLIDYSQSKLHRTGPEAYVISIGFAGACFCASGAILLGAWRHSHVAR